MGVTDPVTLQKKIKYFSKKAKNLVKEILSGHLNYSEDRRQRTEDRGQRTEDRGRKTEDGRRTKSRKLAPGIPLQVVEFRRWI